MSKLVKLSKCEIPFSKYWQDGTLSLDSYAGYSADNLTPNFIFFDTLIFQGFSRGRSSVTANFTNKEGTMQSSMFVSNFSDIIHYYIKPDFKNLTGYFCMCKKGANFGLKYLGEIEPENTGLEIVEDYVTVLMKKIEEKK
jgi:hypothetical protein